MTMSISASKRLGVAPVMLGNENEPPSRNGGFLLADVTAL
jgi:hypothetical protein